MVKKLKLLASAEIWSLDLVENAKFDGGFSLFVFLTRNTFLSKFGQKNSNKVTFGTYNKLNIQTPMVMYIFSLFDQKCSFWVNLVQNIKIFS